MNLEKGLFFFFAERESLFTGSLSKMTIHSKTYTANAGNLLDSAEPVYHTFGLFKP